MAKRRKQRRREHDVTPTIEYRDGDGNVLELRESLSAGTIAKIRSGSASPGASIEDMRARREEMLFERLVRRWEIAGMPITGQKMLLGRLRMASADELAWVRGTIAAHVEAHIPELGER